jgi:hypothetical protein
LAARWQAQGKTVAYAAVGPTAAEHAEFVGPALGLPAAMVVAGTAANALTLPKADVVIVELADGLAAAEAAGALGGRVLLLVRYRQHVAAGDIVAAAAGCGDMLAGVVVTAAPAKYILPLREALTAGLAAMTFTLLGIIPEDRALMGFTVGELADHLGANYLCRPDRSGELIEHLMVGSNAPDPAFSYFQAKPRTAIICRANRPDQQLAALEQPVNCMVFTGDGHVQTSVVYRAEDAGVPILAVPGDTIGTVHRLDGLAERVRFRQAAKAPVVQDLVDGRIDWPRLDHALGLT